MSSAVHGLALLIPTASVMNHGGRVQRRSTAAGCPRVQAAAAQTLDPGRAAKGAVDERLHLPKVRMSVWPGRAMWCCWMVW